MAGVPGTSTGKETASNSFVDDIGIGLAGFAAKTSQVFTVSVGNPLLSPTRLIVITAGGVERTGNRISMWNDGIFHVRWNGQVPSGCHE